MFSVKNFKEDFDMKSNGFVSKFLVGATLVAINSFVGVFGSETAQIISGVTSANRPNNHINSNTDRRGQSSRDPWRPNPCGHGIFQPPYRAH